MMRKSVRIERVVLFYSNHGEDNRGWCYTAHTVEADPDGDYREADCTSIPGSADWSRTQARQYAADRLPAGTGIEDGEDDIHGAIGGYRRG